MKNAKFRELIRVAIVAAIYVAITLLFYPLSYGAIQFRISECLVLLTFFNKKYGIGVTFGVLIANFFNPQFAWIDCIFGTLSTAIAVLLICITKKLFIASLWPVLTSFIIVLEIWFFVDKSTPIWLLMIQIMGSMLIIESVIGYFLFRILGRNENFMRLMVVTPKEKVKEDKNNEIQSSGVTEQTE